MKKSVWLSKISIRARQKRILRKKAQRKKEIKRKRALAQGVCKEELKWRNIYKRKFYDYIKIPAPDNLSLIDNTESVLHFISRLRECFEKKKKVFINLSRVSNISGDGILILLSNLVLFKTRKIKFNGNYPKDKKTRNKLEKTCFYDAIYNFNYAEESKYDLTKNDIFTHAQKNVDSQLTADLITKNSAYLWGEERRCTGLQRVFLELMQNTNNHASKTIGDKYWWLNMEKKKDPKRICFSFIDYGMGIFKSLDNKPITDKLYDWVKKISPWCNPQNHAELLKNIFEGTFHKTVTGKEYRGKGIPGIYNRLKTGYISNLVLISNDSMGKPNEDKYEILDNKLNGTFVYIEIDAQCKNLPLAV